MQRGRDWGEDDTMGTSVGLVVVLDVEVPAFCARYLI